LPTQKKLFFRELKKDGNYLIWNGILNRKGGARFPYEASRSGGMAIVSIDNAIARPANSRWLDVKKHFVTI
jgi:hypothetical protein